MAKSDLRIKVTVDTSQMSESLEAVLGGRATPVMRRTLEFLRCNRRTSGIRLAALTWPKHFDLRRDLNPRAQTSVTRMADGRLAAAAKAGYAHVSFERDTPVFEISARGLAAIGARARTVLVRMPPLGSRRPISKHSV